MSFGVSGGAEKTKDTSKTKASKTSSGLQTSQLQLDQEAIDKIISDVLGSEQGLASIFSGEQTAGIFDSSVAAQSAGDLAANLVGEIAKLTGKTVTTDESEEDIEERTLGRGKQRGVQTFGKFAFSDIIGGGGGGGGG